MMLQEVWYLLRSYYCLKPNGTWYLFAIMWRSYDWWLTPNGTWYLFAIMMWWRSHDWWLTPNGTWYLFAIIWRSHDVLINNHKSGIWHKLLLSKEKLS
jgi:hypothetical protein